MSCRMGAAGTCAGSRRKSTRKSLCPFRHLPPNRTAITSQRLKAPMPTKPRGICKSPLCRNRSERDSNGYCSLHAQQHRKATDTRRGTAKQRGYTAHWRRLRKYYLIEYPLCANCLNKGITTQATEVHHILPLAAGGTHDYDNLMALCHSCHSRITIRESGMNKGRERHRGWGRSHMEELP